MAKKGGLGAFFLKWAVGLALLWLGAASACVLVEALAQVPWTSKSSLVFLAGFGGYLLVHYLLYQPVLSHVMAHELTHALAAMAMGGKVTSISASTTGGTTVTNRSHVLVSLAPYVFPLYTMVALGLYAISAPGWKIWFLGLTGATFAFHLALTVYSLSHHQPDLEEGGVAFSLLFILSGNIIVAMLLTSFVWPTALPPAQLVPKTLGWAWHLAQGLLLFVKSHLISSSGKTH
jgi:hypothetical protein